MGLLQEKLAKHPFYSMAQEVKEKGIYPYFREIEGKQGTEVEMGGQHVLMFGSNAYTGLTGDDRIIEAGCKAMKQYGSGCAGSRFLNGTLDIHVKLEKELAEFVGKDDSDAPVRLAADGPDRDIDARLDRNNRSEFTRKVESHAREPFEEVIDPVKRRVLANLAAPVVRIALRDLRPQIERRIVTAGDVDAPGRNIRADEKSVAFQHRNVYPGR